MNESEQHAITQIRILWPFLTYLERVTYVQKFRHLYNDSFPETILALSGKEIPEPPHSITTGTCDEIPTGYPQPTSPDTPQ
jgi:hypothetical protein